MTRFQMRKWTILLAAVILVATGNSAAAVAQEGNDPFVTGKPATVNSADDAAMEAAIRKALGHPTSMEFIETPLQEAVDYLKDLHQIEIQLDVKALEEAGHGSDTPVTATLKKIALGSALKLLLSKYDLTFVVDKGVLLITTPAAAANMVELRVYDVHDLLAQGDVQELSEILRLALDYPVPPRKVEVAKQPPMPGTTRTQRLEHESQSGSVILSYGNLIVVRASILEHEAIAELLENMRTAMRQAPK